MCSNSWGGGIIYSHNFFDFFSFVAEFIARGSTCAFVSACMLECISFILLVTTSFLAFGYLPRSCSARLTDFSKITAAVAIYILPVNVYKNSFFKKKTSFWFTCTINSLSTHTGSTLTSNNCGLWWPICNFLSGHLQWLRLRGYHMKKYKKHLQPWPFLLG